MQTFIYPSMNFSELYELERQARKEGRPEDLKRIFLEMLSLCGDDKEVVSLIRVLAARRGQDRNVIKWLVNEVYSRNKEEEFVKSLLKEVIEGKMYLEAERVAITTDLKNRYSSREALDVILDVPVETFTMIPESTIVNYQLEQFRLCVEVKDWVKADITRKKIRKKYFSENNARDEEILFHKYIVDLYLGQDKFLEASTTYIRLSEIVEEKEFTILASFFGILCTCQERESSKEHLVRLSNDRNNEEGMRIVLDKFLSTLLIPKEYVSTILALVNKYRDVSIYTPHLLQAIDEHNFFIVEAFYSSISISTCSRLLDVDPEDLVNRISFLVNKGLSNSKIDQKEGIVVFKGKEWSSNVGDVLNKLMRVEHMIHKEKLKKIIKT